MLVETSARSHQRLIEMIFSAFLFTVRYESVETGPAIMLVLFLG